MKILKLIKTGLVFAISLAVAGNDVAQAAYFRNSYEQRYGAAQQSEIPGYDDNAGWQRRRRVRVVPAEQLVDHVDPVPVEQPVILCGPNINGGDRDDEQKGPQKAKTSCCMNALKTAGNCTRAVLSVPVNCTVATVRGLNAVGRFAWKHKNVLIVTTLLTGAAYMYGRSTVPTSGPCGPCEDQSPLVGSLQMKVAGLGTDLVHAQNDHNYCLSQIALDDPSKGVIHTTNRFFNRLQIAMFGR